jgi:hypothetical protein
MLISAILSRKRLQPEIQTLQRKSMCLGNFSTEIHINKVLKIPKRDFVSLVVIRHKLVKNTNLPDLRS